MKRAELQRFAAGEDGLRYNISLPWSRGEWSYATNRHIIVRVPRLADVDENPQTPDAEKLFVEAKQTEFIPVPVCAMPADVDCKHCGGAGVIWVSRHQNERCGWCDHTGKVPCFDGMDVGDSHFAQRYLAMIQGWEIAPNGPDNPAWIRNGEAVGLLMPRRKD